MQKNGQLIIITAYNKLIQISVLIWRPPNLLLDVDTRTLIHKQATSLNEFINIKKSLFDYIYYF